MGIVYLIRDHKEVMKRNKRLISHVSKGEEPICRLQLNINQRVLVPHKDNA